MCRERVCVTALCLAFAMAGSAGAQTILFEYWDNIGNGTAVSDLTSNAAYPDNPTSSAWLKVFQSPSGRADNYGCRARAYLTQPETGDYTFWVAGDDYCQLWLSTDTNPANAVMIAQVPGWTGVAEWGKYPEQKSAPVSLTAGQAYYIEGLMKEAGGGDSLDVGWAGPGIGETTTIIAGQYCTPFIRYQARAPEPANGAVDWTSPVFTWTPGDTTTNCEVYIGTSPELTQDSLMGQWRNMYYHFLPLEPGVTYYWRVDGIEADGSKITGNVWSFTARPLTAHAPSPKNGALLPGSEPPTALSWTAGQNVASHDVYFGTDQAAVAAGDARVAVSMGQTETSFAIDPDSLFPLTTYYWRVDEVDLAGVVQAGDVWSFQITDKTTDINIENWAFGTGLAEPKFFAAYVADGLYDIGAFGGEMTYEFVVCSNPDEVEASMCLIGRRQFGDTRAGLKYEQWNNTGTYGATLFGVMDYDYGVPTAPGEYTHLVFVASTAAGKTDLYVNGEFRGSVPVAIVLSGKVGIGYGAQVDAPGYFDNFDGVIFGVAIYDRVLTADEIAANADKYFSPDFDVTAPGDIVQGVPNDGDWPTAEYPALAIDNDFNTKFLHFKGETQPTGIQITPAVGATVVTGLTFTTANDFPERDPVMFEFYGSNDSIDGPWMLIAAGEIVDFAQATAWPRFTTNATPISFENTVEYRHYQVLFPAVRDPSAANSMQIGEVQLLGLPCIGGVCCVVVHGYVQYCGDGNIPNTKHPGIKFVPHDAVSGGYTNIIPQGMRKNGEYKVCVPKDTYTVYVWNDEYPYPGKTYSNVKVSGRTEKNFCLP